MIFDDADVAITAKFSRSQGGEPTAAALQQEYEATKARYAGTAQWRQAPNGQPSNLTEQQWVTVRTPRFKAWFGDWEAGSHQSYLMEAPVTTLTGSEFPKSETPLTERVANWFESEFDGKAVHPLLGEVILNERGVKDSIAHGLGRTKSVAFAAVPDIILHGRLIDVEKNWKGKPYDGYTLAAPVRIGKKDYVGVVIVHRDANQRFYLQEVILRDALQPEPFKTEALTGTSAALNGGHAGAIARVLRNVFAVNREAVSKVVDENGEPLVVYHGTNDSFSTFEQGHPNKKDSGWLGKGFYFSNKTDTANSYTHLKPGGQPNIMPVFLHMESPKAATGRDKEPLMLAERRGETEAFEQATQRLKAAGQDGVIVDYGMTDGTKEYVVFDANQIKSATGNTGAFSASHDDIRFSRRSGLNNDPGEREGPGIEENPEALFADIDDAIRQGGGWAEAKGELGQRWHKLNASARRQWLGALTVHQLVELGSQVVPRMEQYLKEMTGMDVTRNTVLHEVDDIAKAWEKLDQQTLGRLAHVMHESTLAGVDGQKAFTPSIDKKAAIKEIAILKRRMLAVPGDDKWKMMTEIRTLKKRIRFEERREQAYAGIRQLFQALPQAAKDVYVRSRDYHVAQSKRVEDALVEMIENTKMSGQQRAAAVAKLRKEFEAQRVNAPYFPLSRQGDYWVSIAPPKDRHGEFQGEREFHLFQTLEQQTAFIEESQAAGMELLGRGKQLENLQETIGVPGSFVAQVEDIIGQLGEGHPLVESVRDQVYQLYLQTLPDLSARKHFIHRKKTPGFGRDALRAFASKGYHDAYQYARVKHGFEMRSIMEKLREDLETASSQPRMQALHARRALLEEFRTEVLNAGMGYQAVKERAEGLDLQALEVRAQADRRRLGEGEQFVADEAKKWKQFLAWMDEWTRYGGIPDRVNQEIADIDLRFRTARLINTRERGYEFGADVYNELQAAYGWLMNPRTAPWATALNQMGYLYNLAFSPSAWATNATQNPLVTMPYVAARHGVKRTQAAFAEAYREAFRGAVSKSASKEHALGIREALTRDDEIRAYTWALDAGLIERGRAMDLAGTAEEGQDRSAWHRKFSLAMTVGFHDVERLNRETSFMAAYRLARTSGQDFDTATGYAAEVVNKTHLVYTSENRPRFMRSDVARVLLQFKLYSQGITYLLGKAVVEAVGKQASAEEKAEARRFLAFQMGMQAAAAGALGLPVGLAWWAAQAAFAALFDDDDDPKELEPEFRKALAEALGTTGGEAVAKGLVNALLPVDLHSRIGMRALWFRESDREAEGKDAASRLLSNLMGPMAGIMENLFVGSQMVSEGHVYRGIEKMTPKFIRDPLKALRYASEGVQTLKGDPLIDDLSSGEVLGQLLGFSPSRLNERYDENNAEKNRQRRIEERRQKLTGDLAQSRIDGAMAQRQGDDRKRSKAQALFEEAMANAKRFNEKQPGFAIGGKTVGRSIQSRVRARAMAKDGIFLNRKIPERYDYATEDTP